MSHVHSSVFEAGYGVEDAASGVITRPGNLADDGYTYDNDKGVLTIRTGGFDCTVTFTVPNGNAEANRPDCS